MSVTCVESSSDVLVAEATFQCRDAAYRERFHSYGCKKVSLFDRHGKPVWVFKIYPSIFEVEGLRDAPALDRRKIHVVPTSMCCLQMRRYIDDEVGRMSDEVYLSMFKRLRIESASYSLSEVTVCIEPCSSVFSQIQFGIRVSTILWGVALIGHKGICGNHAKVVVEGCDEDRGYFLKIADFATDRTVIIRDITDKAHVAPCHPPDDSPLVYSARSELWKIPRDRVEVMLASIMQDVKISQYDALSIEVCNEIRLDEALNQAVQASGEIPQLKAGLEARVQSQLACVGAREALERDLAILGSLEIAREYRKSLVGAFTTKEELFRLLEKLDRAMQLSKEAPRLMETLQVRTRVQLEHVLAKETLEKGLAVFCGLDALKEYSQACIEAARMSEELSQIEEQLNASVRMSKAFIGLRGGVAISGVSTDWACAC